MSHGVKLFIASDETHQLSQADLQNLVNDLFREKMIDLPWAILKGEHIDLMKPRNMVKANFAAKLRGKEKLPLLKAIDELALDKEDHVLWFSGMNWSNFQLQTLLEKRGYYNGNIFIVLLHEPRSFQTEHGEITLKHFVLVHGNRAPEELEGTPIFNVFERYFGTDLQETLAYYEVENAARLAPTL